MKKRKWLPSLSHLLLWSHVLGVIGFYIVLWRRTAPAKEDRIEMEPPKTWRSLKVARWFR